MASPVPMYRIARLNGFWMRESRRYAAMDVGRSTMVNGETTRPIAVIHATMRSNARLQSRVDRT